MGFPRELPREQLTHIIEHIRTGGSGHSVAALIEDCYDVLGYGLFVAFGSDHPQPVGALPGSEDQAAILESALVPEGAFASPDWATIAFIVLQLLQELMKKQ